MTTQLIRDNFIEAQAVLNNFINNPENFGKIAQTAQIMANAINAGNKIISCGNGGSMADAMHFAEELTGRYRNNRQSIAAISISDPTHLSCTANDYGYDFVFSRYIQGVGNKGDVLLAISTSGNSVNIIKAVEAAREKNMKVITLTGKDGGKLANLSDIEIRVEHFGFADRIQEIHIKIIHTLIYCIESLIVKEA